MGLCRDGSGWGGPSTNFCASADDASPRGVDPSRVFGYWVLSLGAIGYWVLNYLSASDGVLRVSILLFRLYWVGDGGEVTLYGTYDSLTWPSREQIM